ncbi:peptidase inhibitor family I36 protein [Streptomyces sp. NPDC088560]|uniref:peptidase inhibitor family I36 protein n=1 Tax=Streptomyces sp. NPDC088560 TaxID=3365868 RepID=UPI003830AAE4
MVLLTACGGQAAVSGKQEKHRTTNAGFAASGNEYNVALDGDTPTGRTNETPKTFLQGQHPSPTPTPTSTPTPTATPTATASTIPAPPCSGICFYEDFSYAGDVSDQTKTLVKGPGEIHRLTNSHYQQSHRDINDSISSVINNTDRCLQLYYDFDFGHNTQGDNQPFGMVVGKYTSVVLDSHTDVRFNDKFSSAQLVDCGSEENFNKTGNWGYLVKPDPYIAERPDTEEKLDKAMARVWQ